MESNLLMDFKHLLSNLKMPDDIVCAVLSSVPEANIHKDPILIHHAFYNLSKKHTGLLSAFRFNISGLHPYSEELERALFRLETAKSLETLNPGYSRYHIDKEKLRESFSKFSEEEQDEIFAMGVELAQLLKEQICTL